MHKLDTGLYLMFCSTLLMHTVLSGKVDPINKQKVNFFFVLRCVGLSSRVEHADNEIPSAPNDQMAEPDINAQCMQMSWFAHTRHLPAFNSIPKRKLEYR